MMFIGRPRHRRYTILVPCQQLMSRACKSRNRLFAETGCSGMMLARCNIVSYATFTHSNKTCYMLLKKRPTCTVPLVLRLAAFLGYTTRAW